MRTDIHAILHPEPESPARSRADAIRAALGAVADNLDAIPGLVAQAKAEGDWDALGYESWEAYVKAEFGTGLLRLDRSVRRMWSRSLRDAGLSTREIAPVVNAHHSTVADDLSVGNPTGSGEENSSPRPKSPSISEQIRQMERENLALREQRDVAAYDRDEALRENKALGEENQVLGRENRRLRAAETRLRARVLELAVEVSLRPKGNGRYYDDRTQKLLNLAMGTDSKDEATNSFQSAWRLFRKSKAVA